MAHEHKLEIFRGLVKFKSNIAKIWGVLAFLTFITLIEVVLGIYKPEILMHTWIAPFEGGFMAGLGNILLSPFIAMKPLNLIFIIRIKNNAFAKLKVDNEELTTSLQA